MIHAPGFLALVAQVRANIKETDVKDVRNRLASVPTAFRLIDVREDHEWQEGHIPGALHLGRGILERDIERLVPDPATPPVLYCGGGFRSALAADNLQKMGYTRVESMGGGFRAWKEAGGPIER